ncbi:uncharacterized protein LOC111614085 [Centruroides sculpturatus]|uniref:uncharacterized protein LOC111614085 n=1 Tax=Centruroides sculpturatus TaxID=218467 RepID=UPI000C6EF65D|nr:uncharacterized protein LOC111614085 [Centruroides sculpturatus]
MVSLVFEKFKDISGTEMNPQKCKGLWIGAWENLPSNYLGFNWSQTNIKSLGILIGKNSNEQWNKNIEKVRKASYMWRGRNISITGKAKLANIKLLSPFWYLIHTQPLPKRAVTQINRICATFIWGSNFEPIRRTTLYNSLENGGAGLLEVSLKTLIQRIKLINNLHKYGIWTSLAKAFLQPHIPNIIITTEKIHRLRPPTILLEIVRCYRTMKENFSDEIIFTSTPKELYYKVIDKFIPKLQNRICQFNLKSKNIIKIISKLNIPSKAKTIFWKLQHNCLQTNEWRKQKKIYKLHRLSHMLQQRNARTRHPGMQTHEPTLDNIK